ncbi:MAG: nucleotidyl transferase AbiEii/AbiGii toxin family protein [Chloroflexi bacterium]|nr:nucleotidyl transferase AbiEii/AbiGii toxin family protein [Chloroflexota bacterium]
MRYATAAAFRRALEARLLEHARTTGLPLVRLRRMVVFERLLARQLTVAPDRWVLKGGLALDYRLGSRARTTRDMDLGRHDDESAATADLRAGQAVDLGDFFVFRVERTSHLDVALEGAAVRYRVRAELAGRPFEVVTLDVGFSPPSALPPDVVSASDLLAFAGIEPITVPVLPLAQHVAEKVHAYTRTYGAEAIASTRVKDLVDLVLICSEESLEADALQRALEETFAARATHQLPAALPPPPSSWTTPYAKIASELGLAPDVVVAYQTAARFLNPVLTGTAPPTARWDPAAHGWTTPATSAAWPRRVPRGPS